MFAVLPQSLVSWFYSKGSISHASVPMSSAPIPYLNHCPNWCLLGPCCSNRPGTNSRYHHHHHCNFHRYCIGFRIRLIYMSRTVSYIPLCHYFQPLWFYLDSISWYDMLLQTVIYSMNWFYRIKLHDNEFPNYSVFKFN